MTKRNKTKNNLQIWQGFVILLSNFSFNLFCQSSGSWLYILLQMNTIASLGCMISLFSLCISYHVTDNFLILLGMTSLLFLIIHLSSIKYNQYKRWSTKEYEQTILTFNYWVTITKMLYRNCANLNYSGQISCELNFLARSSRLK